MPELLCVTDKSVLTVHPTHPCPCASGKQVRDCCGTDGIVRPSYATARSGMLSTGAVKGCYAACLGDCGGKISSEHPISENLLNKLSHDDKVHAKGPAWRGGKWLAPSALGSNILCQRHNESLSAFDGRMGRSADFILHVATYPLRKKKKQKKRSPPQDRLFVMHGRDLERWLLKCLCGQVAGGHAADLDGVRFPRQVPPQWVRVLFGCEDMPRTWGAYITFPDGAVVPGSNIRGVVPTLGRRTIQSAPLSRDGQVIGLRSTVFGWQIDLLMHDVDPDQDGWVYRPTQVNYQVPYRALVHLYWEPDDRSIVPGRTAEPIVKLNGGAGPT